jgi:hypothetical protein
VHAYGISGEYDHLAASLSRIQKTLGKKEKQGVTWRARRAEHVNEILKGACGYDDLSVEEVVQAIQEFKGGRAGGERGDGWRGGGGSGRDTAAVAGIPGVGRPPRHRLRLLSLTRPRLWGTARILWGRIQACRWKGSFTAPRGSVSVATGSGIPVRRQTVVKSVSGTRWREAGRVVPQAGAVRPGPN